MTRRVVRRLKSISTMTTGSLVEVFENGLQKQIEEKGHIYDEVILTKEDIGDLMSLTQKNNKNLIPKWLGDEKLIELSVSQRLIVITPMLIKLRIMYGLHFELKIFLNSVLPVMAIIKDISCFLRHYDQIIVNTDFASRLLINLIHIDENYIAINPPVPEICAPSISDLHSNNLPSKCISLATFSRVIPEKLIHKIIEAMKTVKRSCHLKIYGFQYDGNEYEKYLLYIRDLYNLNKVISFEKVLTTKEDRIAAIQSVNAVINLSTTFEETMGKAILESLSWDRKVIANQWNGFADILSSDELLKTHWNPWEWYTIDSDDLVTAIENLELASQGQEYEKFKYFRDSWCYSSMINLSQEKVNRMVFKEEQIDNSILDDWCRYPINTLIQKNTSLLNDKSSLIENYYAPNLVRSEDPKVNINQFLPHPLKILEHCKAQKIDPKEELIRFIESTTPSPFRTLAHKLLEEFQ